MGDSVLAPELPSPPKPSRVWRAQGKGVPTPSAPSPAWSPAALTPSHPAVSKPRYALQTRARGRLLRSL